MKLEFVGGSGRMGRGSGHEAKAGHGSTDQDAVQRLNQGAGQISGRGVGKRP